MTPGEIGLGLVALLGVAIGSLSYAIALKVKLEDVFAAVLSSTPSGRSSTPAHSCWA